MSDSTVSISSMSYEKKDDVRILTSCLSKWFSNPKILHLKSPLFYRSLPLGFLAIKKGLCSLYTLPQQPPCPLYKRPTGFALQQAPIMIWRIVMLLLCFSS